MDRLPAGLSFVLLTLAASCTEPGSPAATAGARPFGLSFAAGGAAACPTSADATVSDEAGLAAALANASPGDVIALGAFFPVTADVVIAVENVTLTCATPGAGILATPGAGIVELVNVAANGVIVDRLLIDASATDADPYFALGVTGVRVTNNTVKCSSASCAFLPNVSGAVIADNRFESAGSFTGVHMQGGIDGSRVEGNTLVTTALAGPAIFGALRVRDGADVVISDNTVSGPWPNSLALADLANSRIEHNRLEGAELYGIQARAGMSLVAVSMTDNVFRNNQISGAGSAGIFLTSACRNELFGNNLQGNADDLGAVFDVPTGANVMVGNKNVVIDNGDFDCDGDGVADPNTITGPGRVKRGVAFGAPDDAAPVTVNGRTLR